MVSPIYAGVWTRTPPQLGSWESRETAGAVNSAQSTASKSGEPAPWPRIGHSGKIGLRSLYLHNTFMEPFTQKPCGNARPHSVYRTWAEWSTAQFFSLCSPTDRPGLCRYHPVQGSWWQTGPASGSAKLSIAPTMDSLTFPLSFNFWILKSGNNMGSAVFSL